MGIVWLPGARHAIRMPPDTCAGRGARHAQHRHPVWEPLVDAVGERLAEGFMWMHENRFEDGSSVHAYKHVFTRRYLYLSEDGRAFEVAACGRYMPLRLDFAIEAALCTWWILIGWEEEDRAAVYEAVVRAQSSTWGAE